MRNVPPHYFIIVALVGFVHRLFLSADFLQALLPAHIVTWLGPLLSIIYGASWLITGVWLLLAAARAIIFLADFGAKLIDCCWRKATQLTINLLRKALAKLDDEHPPDCADSRPVPETGQGIPKKGN